MLKKRLIVSLVTLFVITACGVSSGLGFKTVKGSGEVIAERRDMTGFTRVSVCCGMELVLTQVDHEALEIEADDNFMDEIVTKVENGSLRIQFQDTSNVNYQPSRPVRVSLMVKDIDEVKISGGGLFKTDSLTSNHFEVELSGGSDAVVGALKVDDLMIHISGGGDIEADSIEAQEFDLDLSGGSDIETDDLRVENLILKSSGGGKVALSGFAINSDIHLSGGSSLAGSDMESQVMRFECSGGGHSTVWVQDSLDVELSGGSFLEYFGQPGTVTQNLSNSTELEALGDH